MYTLSHALVPIIIYKPIVIRKSQYLNPGHSTPAAPVSVPNPAVAVVATGVNLDGEGSDWETIELHPPRRAIGGLAGAGRCVRPLDTRRKEVCEPNSLVGKRRAVVLGLIVGLEPDHLIDTFMGRRRGHQ